MAIRITCPACSATLSVKDEYAGRAVKCPKCGGVIPASAQEGTSPSKSAPALPPEPAAKPSFEEVPDEPAPAKPKITAKPAAKTDDEDAPKKKSVWDDGDDDRANKKKSRDDDRNDEKGKGKKDKRNRDDDDDDRSKKKKSGGGGGMMIVLIICGTLLLVCGGIGYGVYRLVTGIRDGVKEGIDKINDSIEKSNFAVTKSNYDQMKVGTATRGSLESATSFNSLNKGRTATTEDLKLVFGSDQKKIDEWTPKVNVSRAVMWRNGDDFIIAAFHPAANDQGRLQAKEWRPKIGATAADGELDDIKFAQKYPPLTNTTEIKGEDLSKEYKDSFIKANETYKDKTFIVVGKFNTFNTFGNDLTVVLESYPPSAPGKFDGGTINCKLAVGQTPFAYSRGQKLKISGKCIGGIGSSLDFENCTIKSGEDDTSVKVTADKLIADYGNMTSADNTYKGKELTITGARIDSINNGVVNASPVGKKGLTRKIVISFDSELKNKFTNLRVGATVTVKGRCNGLVDDEEIKIDDAWFVP